MPIGQANGFLLNESGNMRRKVATADYILGAASGIPQLFQHPTSRAEAATQMTSPLTQKEPAHSE